MILDPHSTYIQVFGQRQDRSLAQVDDTVLQALAVAHNQPVISQAHIHQAQFIHFTDPQPGLPEQVESRSVQEGIRGGDVGCLPG